MKSSSFRTLIPPESPSVAAAADAEAEDDDDLLRFGFFGDRGGELFGSNGSYSGELTPTSPSAEAEAELSWRVFCRLLLSLSCFFFLPFFCFFCLLFELDLL